MAANRAARKIVPPVGARGATLTAGHDERLVARDGVERRFIEIQVRGDQLWRSVREPFGEREVLIVRWLLNISRNFRSVVPVFSM